MNISSSKERLEICKSCDRLSKLLLKCKECGCYMVIKVNMPNEKCPLDKW